MVGRGDEDSIDGFVVKHLPQIGDHFRRCAFGILHRLRRDGCAAGVDIADISNLDISVTGEILHMIRTHAAGSDHTDDKLFIRSCGRRRR